MGRGPGGLRLARGGSAVAGLLDLVFLEAQVVPQLVAQRHADLVHQLRFEQTRHQRGAAHGMDVLAKPLLQEPNPVDVAHDLG